MTPPPQTGLPEASGSTNESRIFASCGAGLDEPFKSPGRNTKEETEYLLKLVASLESCNTALFNKLAQTQRELDALKNPPAHTGTEPTGNTKQSYGWERKLTRAGWRPS